MKHVLMKNNLTRRRDDLLFSVEKSQIGCDEVGTGDFFGPVIVCAAYVSKEHFSYLKQIGIKDSKKCSKKEIKTLFLKIHSMIPYSCYQLDNKNYNEMIKDKNLNEIKSILHNQAILDFNKYPYERVIIDQFVEEKKYYSYLKDQKMIQKDIQFVTYAESEFLSVACASIIASYFYLKELEKLSKTVKKRLIRGSSLKVNHIAYQIVKEKGFESLSTISKLNFKNKKVIEKKYQEEMIWKKDF